MTLLLAADLHIGAGASLGRLADQQSSWTRLCTTAVEVGADVLFAGDAFHHRKPSPSELRAFQAGLDVLAAGDRTLIAIAGNHDVSSMDAPTALEAACAGYDAHVLRTSQVIETSDGPVAFLPWAPYSDARRTAEALLILAEHMGRDEGARVLVAHWSLSGASLPTGLPVLELAEPILDSFALAQMGYDIVLAGHIHKRQVVVEEPLVAHIGPLARGNFGEASVETGAWQISPIALPTILAPLLRPLVASWFEIPDRAFVTIEADVTEAGHYAIDQILDEISDADVGEAIVRVRYQQRADQQIDQAVILATLAEYGAHRVDRLEPIVERIQSTRSAGVSETSDPREAWDSWQAAQGDVASEETLTTARERAHERIGSAS